jgi:tetratricopeptide (TPR) repeat protein
MRDILRKNKKTFILFFCLSCLFYGNTLKNKYALDDEYVTVTNFPVQGQQYQPNHKLVSKGFGGIVKIWRSRYAHDNEGASEYRPFVITTFAIEYAIFGQNPFVSHLINLLLYFITVCLLYCILMELFKNYPGNASIAFLCSLLFLIHPVHTEVVCSLKNRDEMLSFLFSMAALWFSLKAYDKPSLKNVLPIFIFLMLGMFSKRTSVLALAIIPLCLLFFRKVTLRQCIYFASAVVIILITVGLIKRSLLTETMVRFYFHFENPLYTDHFSLGQKLIIGIKTFGFYVKFLFFPYPFRYYYGANTFDVSDSLNIYFFIAVSFILLCAYFIFKRRDKLFLFSFLLFCGCIVPFANIGTPAPGILGERFAYFASFGFCLMATVTILPYMKNISFNSAMQFFSKPLLYITPLIFIFMLYIWNRNSNWYNKMTLFEHDTTPYLKESAKANSLMGNEYFEALSNRNSKYPLPTLVNKALEHYGLAVKNDSSIYTAYNNAGVVYYSYLNNLDKAEQSFKLALRHKSDYPQALENLGNVYKQKKMYDLAVLNYKKALLYKPKQYNAAFELTNCLIAQKKYRACIVFCDAYLTIYPFDYTFLVQKANSLFFLNRKEESIAVYESAYEAKPSNELRTYINSISTNTAR